MKCSDCHTEIGTTTTCTAPQLNGYGRVYDRVRCEESPMEPGVLACECGVSIGATHHRGCDLEECPRCGGQLLSCGCKLSIKRPD